MGSFTAGTATVVMKAIFPTANTTLVPISVSTTAPAGFKIYNSTSGTANQIGILSQVTNVVHRIDLITGSTVATGSSTTPTPMTDVNFATTPAAGTITGTLAVQGTLAYCHATGVSGLNYISYTGKLMGTATPTAHTWAGWTITDGTGTTQPKAVNNGQIAFPTLGTGSVAHTVYGFAISACTTTESAPTSYSALIAATTSGMPVVIAYGDLSTARGIAVTDTPVFTAEAIQITLE